MRLYNPSIDLNLTTAAVHRVIWILCNRSNPINDVLDHDDGDKTNNRIENLIDATHKANSRNRKSDSNSTSIYLGVSWSSINETWRAIASIGTKQVFSENYQSEWEAAKARDYFILQSATPEAALHYTYNSIDRKDADKLCLIYKQERRTLMRHHAKMVRQWISQGLFEKALDEALLMLKYKTMNTHPLIA